MSLALSQRARGGFAVLPALHSIPEDKKKHAYKFSGAALFVLLACTVLCIALITLFGTPHQHAQGDHPNLSEILTRSSDSVILATKSFKERNPGGATLVAAQASTLGHSPPEHRLSSGAVPSTSPVLETVTAPPTTSTDQSAPARVAASAQCEALGCGAGGVCASGGCQCTVLFEGQRCSPKALPSLPGAPRFHADFNGRFVQSKEGMAGRTKLELRLPHKESEADRGHRILADGAAFKELVAVLPDRDDVLGSRIYERCAVVGSSGILRVFAHGADIDTHDMVMRFNSAPTKGFEAHVGSKTTHRITNTQNWAFHESDAEAILVHFRAPTAVKGLFWNAKQRKRLPIYAFDPDWVEYMAGAFDFLATSGLYGVMLALQRCRAVHLYGFQVSEAQGVLYHYYNVCDVPANVVRDDAEFGVIKFLAQQGLVQLMEPCILECHGTKQQCSDCKAAANFPTVTKPSTSHCDPHRVSHGHHDAPWHHRRGAGNARQR